jgi:hypothetical protein
MSGEKNFVDDLNKAFGIFGSIKQGNKLTPFTPCAIDPSKYTAFKKLYQEYLERFRMGVNAIKDEYTYSLDILNSKIYKKNRELFGYGYNEEYGLVDTTGTSSGCFSEKLKEKAVFELVEKNEAMLFWYTGKGFVVKHDKKVESLINKVGLSSYEVLIFAVNEIVNIYTIIVVTFKGQEIISVGVSLKKKFMDSLNTALMECRLLEMFYDGLRKSFRYKLSKKEHRNIYEFINLLTDSLNSMEPIYNDFDKVIFKPWMTSLELVVLNTNKYQDFLTIRCVSKDLLNCVANHSIILNSLDKKVLKQYSIGEDSVRTRPDCIIL